MCTYISGVSNDLQSCTGVIESVPAHGTGAVGQVRARKRMDLEVLARAEVPVPSAPLRGLPPEAERGGRPVEHSVAARAGGEERRFCSRRGGDSGPTS